MAGRKKRASSTSDSAEAIKPLIVLILLGTILYGGYSVIQKGRNNGDGGLVADGGDAPPFEPGPPSVSVPAAGEALVAPPQPVGSLSAAADSSGSADVMSPALAETSGPAGPTYVAGREGPPPTAVSPNLALPASDTPDEDGGGGPFGADQPEYAAVPPPATFPGVEADDIRGTPGRPSPAQSSQLAAFTADWDEAHDQLAAGRYAEALSLLSAWYNDADLAAEEHQRLEDLLGQLAGTVIYSQKDLLMPPHIVGAGETLPAVAAPLGVNWQLLAKINGIPLSDELIAGESLKVLRGPFDADVSLSRRRLTLRLTGNYAGSFPMAVGEAAAARSGESLAVVAIQRGQPTAPPSVQQASFEIPHPPQPAEPTIRLEGDLMIVAAEDPAEMAHEPPPTHLIVSRAHLADLLDILTPASRVTIDR